MKGPGLRIGIETRRCWTCPECNAEKKTSGLVSQQRCTCQKPGPLMKLDDQYDKFPRFMKPLAEWQKANEEAETARESQ